ncbi:MAG TPA: pyrroline-5-carboxylate reductase [Pirellulales bacterium]|nr:pyrroline-5-carboxylate reductase [Pirellulales bacterium]
MPENRFGFIGAGRMATALAKGFVDRGLATPGQLVASDPVPLAAEQFQRATGGRLLADNLQVAAQADCLFLAVKPQQMGEILAQLAGRLNQRHLVVSVAAGVALSTIRQALGEGPRLVRVMPNTPCLIGQGASAYCLGPGATPDDGQLVGKLLEAVGLALEVNEKLLDAVTGLSGSGPAFVYMIIEAMSDGGVRMGLPRDVALALAAQTVRGAAELVLTSAQHPAVLKDQVASPGGTTIAGLQVLETGAVRGALMAAVEAAARRSAELGK